MKIRMRHGFHFGAGHNELAGWGEWWQSQNNAGIPVNAIGADNAGPVWEIQNGGYADNTLIWRRSLWDNGFDPNSPDYNAMPEAEATRMLAYKYERLWPSELNPYHVWLKNCNEIRTHTGKGDTWYDNLEPGQWWGRYALTAAQYAVERSYRVVLLSPSSADHDYEFWMQPAMIEFLKYAAAHKTNVMVGLHEYSYVAGNLFAMIGDDNATVADVLATKPDDYWKLKVGRFRMLFEACDRAGIGDWPMLYFPEWGWALDSIPDTYPALDQIVAAHTNIYGPYYRYIAGMGTWYLGPGYGDHIAHATNSLLMPCASFAIDNEIDVDEAFPSGDQPDPPAPSENIARVNFTGWGIDDGQQPVGWYDSDKCPFVQVPYAIVGDDSRIPMEYTKWEGDNPYNPDGQEWNDYACPEGIFMWADMLPPEEHEKYLNEYGRTYHWFSPQKAARSRYRFPLRLEPGTYQLTLEFYGDFGKIVDGEKMPQSDPLHGQVELFAGGEDMGKMMTINLMGENKITREVEIKEAGTYDVGYGILSRFAPGGGTAGVFLNGFSIDVVDEAPPVDKPKIVIVKKPQIANFGETENRWVADWAYQNYGRTTTHSLDDMKSMLASGDPVLSYAVVVNPDEQQDVVDWLAENGYTWERLDVPVDPDPPDFRFTHWPTPHKVVTQEFLANPGDYAGFNLPGHDGIDIRAYHGDPVYVVADGTIAQVNHNPGASNYGIYIRVRHADGYETTYAHLKEPLRSVGEAVRGGDIIGLADNTGNSSGSHLHLTLKKIGTSFTDRCGNVWPYNICDPTPYAAQVEGVTWPGGSPGFPCPAPPDPGDKMDILPYIRGDGRLYEVVNANGGQERFQTQDKGGGEFWQTKNSLAEQLMHYGDWIYRGFDTSPGNGRFYQQEYPRGTNGVRWLPRMMAVGELFTVSLWVQFYDWNCNESAPNSGAVTDTRKLVAHHDTWTSRAGITLNDVIEIEWVNGGEKYFYARDFGLVGWERTHQDPHTPEWSAISEIHEPGQRPDNEADLPDCLK